MEQKYMTQRSWKELCPGDFWKESETKRAELRSLVARNVSEEGQHTTKPTATHSVALEQHSLFSGLRPPSPVRSRKTHSLPSKEVSAPHQLKEVV